VEKRAILAAVLIAGLLLLYQVLFVPAPIEPTRVEAPAATEASRESKALLPKEPSRPPVEPPRPIAVPSIAERVTTIETPVYRAAIATRGGTFVEWTLHYRGNKPMVVPGILGSRGLRIERQDVSPGEVALTADTDRLVSGPDRPSVELSLTGQDPYGVRVNERLRFDTRDYRVEIKLKLENRHSVAQNIEVYLPWVALSKWPEGQAEQFLGQRPTRVVLLSPKGVDRIDLEGLKDAALEGQWIGLESEWYIAALIPRSPGFSLVTRKGGTGEVEIALKAVVTSLAPGESWESQALLYAGPKEYDRLKALGVGLESAIDFGGFPVPRRYGGLPMEWIAVPILWLMNLAYRYIPNYGVAIILLTVLTKILFYPLTLKSMASMKAMQALQPQVNALRAKYKADPQRVQRETLELYRKHKVNPMGGCLPMLIQVPIFYALYLVFSLSVELQSASFLCFGKLFGIDLWICDLAQYDPTYVLPILMGASMFVQQKMTPTVGDPRQAKIMLLMPVVFTFMFLNLPSGLVLYWFVSNMLQIAQQYYLDHKFRPAGIGGKEGKREGARG
jgi:YidC/Oxa1 family membrane protein insertase